MSWILLRDAPASGAWNMALDAALLEAADAGGLTALRLYAWNPATLSFGRNEPAIRRYDRDAIAGQRLATVRRPTGGRAVWHDHELTYAVVGPLAAFGSLRDSYRDIHTMLADALRTLGADVALAPDRPAAGVGEGACFASAAGGEVVATDGRKVAGSAQVRTANAFLQHGSVLLTSGQNLVAQLTRGATVAPAAIGVADLTGPATATWDAVADAVSQAAEQHWGAPGTARSAPPSVTARAEALAARYRDDRWTWRR